MKPEKQYWLDQPENVRLLWRGFLLTLALTVATGAVVDLHPHFQIESWFGFYAIYGFVTCLLMIVAAKALGLLLKRPDNHYDGDQRDE